MTYLYDGRKLISVYCNTWDDEQKRNDVFGVDETLDILHPEYDEPDAATREAASRVLIPDDAGAQVIAVSDVDACIDVLQAWQDYKIDNWTGVDYRPWMDDDSIEDPVAYMARYQRCAVIRELPV